MDCKLSLAKNCFYICLSPKERDEITLKIDVIKEKERINKEINKRIRSERQLKRKEIKLLLLGTGEAGKSTFIKQMKIIYDGGYKDIERRSFIKLIIKDIYDAIIALIKAMNTLKIKFHSKINQVFK